MQIIINLNEIIEKLDTYMEHSKSREDVPNVVCLSFDEVENIIQTIMDAINEIAGM